MCIKKDLCCSFSATIHAHTRLSFSSFTPRSVRLRHRQAPLNCLLVCTGSSFHAFNSFFFSHSAQGSLRRSLFVAQVKLLEKESAFVPDAKFINGLKTSLFISTNVSDWTRILPIHSGRIHVNAADFPPGSVAAFLYAPTPQMLKATEWLRGDLNDAAVQCVQNLSLDDLNVLLYRCEPEEFDTTGSRA